MNTQEFSKILDADKMFYYANQTLSANLIETAMIVGTLVFLVWIVKLAIEKDTQ